MRLALRRFALVLALGLLVAPHSALADAADDRFAQAADHYRQKRWQQACDAFSELLAHDPESPHADLARFFYGEALVQLGRWNEARGQFDELLKRDRAGPHARQALFRAGEAAYMVGDQHAAKDDLLEFQRRFSDDPLEGYVLPYLGSLELQSGNAEAAQKYFSQAIARYPDGPLAAEAQFGLAQALHQSGRLEQARDGYRAVIAADGPLAEAAHLQLGAAENSLGNHQAALETLDRLAARFPGSSLSDKGRLGRGYALFKLARYREAREALETIAGKPPLGAEAAYWLALAQKAENQWQAAVDTLHRIDVEAGHRLAPAIAFHTADSLRHDGHLAAAGDEFERVLARFGGSAWADDALLGKLHIAVDEKEHAESIRLADELASKFPASPLAGQAALAKGQALAALEKPGEAVAVLEPLLKTAASGDAAETEIRTRAQATLATCHAQLGHFDEARQMLAALADAKSAGGLAGETTYHVAELALKSGQAALAQELFASVAGGDGSAAVASRAQSGLGWSHFSAGRWAEAADAFGRVLEADPNGPLAAEAALLRGRALSHLEQFQPALAMYRVVIEQHASSPRAAEALAASAPLYEQLGRPDEARQSYARLVQNHPDFAELDAALFRYAWLLRESDAARADKLFERLRTQFPNSKFVPDATLRLAERAFDGQNFDDAERLLADITGAETPQAVRQPALYLAGRLQMARGQWSAAIAPLERLIAEFPDGELALPSEYLIAESEFRQGKYEEAAGRFALLAAKTPGRTESWLATAELRRAQALAHLRRWSESLQVARGISARFANFDQQYEVEYTIGRSLAAEADFAAARESYAKVIASPAGANTETAAMARWMLGESYFHQQNYTAALAEYRKVDDRHPRWHAAALLQAGKCAEALGQFQSAAEFYRRLLAKYATGELSEEATRRLGALAGRAAGRSTARK
ncbi:MAG: tetratricopeptide repeat protein [Pirellulales bacterium]